MAYMASTGATTAASCGPNAPRWNAMRISKCDPAMSTTATGADTSAVSRTQVRRVRRQLVHSRLAIMPEK